MKKIIILQFIVLFSLMFGLMTVSETVQAFKEIENDEEITSFYEMDSEDLYSVQSETVKVEHGEKIEIDIIRNDDLGLTEEAEIEIFESEDIELESTKKIKVKSDFKLKFKSKSLGNQEVTLKYKTNEKSGEIKLYIYSTEEFDYISAYSPSAARYEPYSDLLLAGEISQSDFSNFVYGSDYEEANSLTSNVTTGSRILVKGKVEFEDEVGNIHPAIGVMIKIYDAEYGNDKLLKTVYTNSTGNYSTFVDNYTAWGEDGYDIYVKVLFENGDVAIRNVYDLDANYYARSFYHQFTHFQDVEDGSEVSQSVLFKWGETHDRTSALHFFQAALYGYDYVDLAHGDQSWSYLNIYFPTGGDTSYYNSLSNTIFITNKRYYRWDTLLHEFGHYVDDKLDLFNHAFSLTGLSHSLSGDLNDMHDKDDGYRLAMTEGFANYFAMVTLRKYVYPIGIEEMYGSITPIPRTIGEKFYNYGIETQISSRKYYGEGHELAVALFLYDLQDTGPEAYDNLSFGHTTIMNAFKYANGSSKARGFEDFLDYFETVTSKDLGDLLTHYGFAPKPVAPSDNYYSTTYAPKFEWIKQGGDSTTSQNDKFVLNIYSPGGTVIFSKGLGDVDEYQLTPAEWNSVLEYDYSYVRWNISGQDTSSPTTRLYQSYSQLMYLPQATILSLSNTTYDMFTNYDEFEWFEFTAPTSGYYEFESTGNLDLYAEFFFDMVTAYNYDGRLYVDDNSGSGYNFKKKVYISGGSTIYIRVSDNYFTQNKTFGIKSTLVPTC